MRLVIVSGICVPHDAISNAVVGQAEIAAGLPGVEVVVLAQHIARPLPCPADTVHDSWALLNHPDFQRADVVVFHWGIRYALFDALAVSRSLSARPIVHFHNCTPAHLVPPHARDDAERSYIQAQLIADQDVEVWTFSEYNRATLLDWGVSPDRIAFVPFPIEAPRPLLDRRDPDHFDIAAVGRLVPAKAQHVLVQAVSLLPDDLRARTRVRLAGNATFSEGTYATDLLALAGDLGIRDHIVFCGQPEDDDLWRLYESSHLIVSTSLHEGLCVPVIEAYMAGCRAIGTTEGNLPYVVQPPDPVVPPSDPVALAAAIERVAHDLPRSPAQEQRVAAMVESYGGKACRQALLDELAAARR
jgi:glycosyltransferase involved in cell wall biosynthesis